MNVGAGRQCRCRLAADRDQRCRHALEQRQQGDDFGRLAGIRNRQHHVLARDHAEVAVARFAGMDEERWRAGGCERRRDLAADMAGLAHAGDRDAAGTSEHQLAGGRKLGADPRQQRAERIAFDLESAATEGLQRRSIRAFQERPPQKMGGQYNGRPRPGPQAALSLWKASSARRRGRRSRRIVSAEPQTNMREQRRPHPPRRARCVCIEPRHSSGTQRRMYAPSASKRFACSTGLKTRKYGAASVPQPAVHCQPRGLSARSASTRVSQNQRAFLARNQQILGQERGDDHPHTVMHPAGSPQLAHAGVDDRNAGAAALPGAQIVGIVA